MENEEKNQTEQSDKSRSVWRELWDYAKIIIAVFVILASFTFCALSTAF